MDSSDDLLMIDRMFSPPLPCGKVLTATASCRSAGHCGRVCPKPNVRANVYMNQDKNGGDEYFAAQHLWIKMMDGVGDKTEFFVNVGSADTLVMKARRS